jgi:NitT/TauT family transport system substrate-binding protein
VAQDELTLQLKWVPQAQFAGYYVALDKGFYDEVGLDVTILPGGPDNAPPQIIAGGGADVIVDWMPAALAARERGLPLVNISQTFQNAGLMMACRRDSGIAGPEDFPGKTIAAWFAGNEYPFLAWMDRLGYSTDGGDPDITVMRQGFNVDPLIMGQADCIAGMSYNETWQIPQAGLSDEEVIWFSYDEAGVATLEDGLWVLEDSLDDPDMVDRLERFVEASLRGWQYAIDNQAEAVEIVLGHDNSGFLTEDYQAHMMAEVAKLVIGTDGTPLGMLEPEDFERTVDVLLTGDSDPVITTRPEDAWTHSIWSEAAGAS